METPYSPQFHPAEKPARGPLKIRWQIALGFGVFILVIAVLLWVFQIAFLGTFYQAIKTAEVKSAAELIQRKLEDSFPMIWASIFWSRTSWAPSTAPGSPPSGNACWKA